MNLAKIELGLGCLFAASIALSTVHPWGNTRSASPGGLPLLHGSGAPDRVRDVLAAKCGDCHSENTRYPLYSHLAPVSWMFEHDVHKGRSNLNMSRWESYSDENRISVLTRLASVVHAGQMPPGTYVMLHPGARLSPHEQELIYDWAKTERKRIREEVSHRTDQSSVEVKTGEVKTGKP
jgi:hypothetical protein